MKNLCTATAEGDSTQLKALLRALEACGNNQSELARRCGVKQPHVWKWVKAGRVPTERVLAVSRATGGAVKPHELRQDLPDIFPPPETQPVSEAA
ncbi:helix-turn-helix domain-containing protein [Pseudomonas guariconensis]|uniref:transcriptional regulator n=1 Tax=Pseudomonas TaxID=286 RepID=UPI00209836B2|nr:MULTISPECIES: YdaS family helix-turn-helix protein [Pseudomonas]MCO7636258.1 helix-turn-helix domain-containing protein [Pseudomonas sp. S 311-6]MCO7516440.1 helix-turn-helix domain-containing protein [Pseudomonas putida]MCO7563899.1 helix-turn-helix domain-containing protein [Pseudomonas mosselii]MCO7606660.1 helix-turn-helix domain-containing protein [Pseudomonas guariconensis]MCO7615295.1 helix-turn-helix domain-containing protein [Pseudomonas guariconensis]